ncbi:TIGR02679 domain-containing protein [Anaerostipes hadrus]|uniref:TIGR02679 domain-containing protein n=1 Tax=Anaerostipes hadrus TaxID=649756 RepID=UPI001D0227FE|nr:TIGR02679 domain-containing protein [Anaerostipes hadrus]MCB5543663.1 TIGR02679 domain-containing protein [Anaerostipes hadrus]
MREDKNSEYNQLLQEAVIYFKKYPVFHKIFSGFRKKYESLGHLGGTVVIKNLTKDEKMQLSGFFQRDFYKNKTISISMQRMEKALKNSKFESLEWMDILEEYFDHKMIWKKEVLQKENEKQKMFFDLLLKEIKSDLVREWLNDRIRERSLIYQRLQKEYRNCPDILKVLLHSIESGITNLPVFFDKKERLAVYAAQVTGNPHFFDSNTTAEIFLFDFISYHFYTQNGEGLSDMEYRNQQYYAAGIIRDDLSNYVTVYGIHAKDTDSVLHSGIEGFCDRKEPILLTLYTLSRLKEIYGEKEIYILENPSVFSWLCQRYPEKSFVCTNGQLRFSAFVLLDQLSRTSDLFYSGDHDPEGLLIAQKLKLRYKKRLTLWNYSRNLYEQNLSDVTLNERRLKQLDQIFIEELQEIKEDMKHQKKAAYQESMLENYILQ